MTAEAQKASGAESPPPSAITAAFISDPYPTFAALRALTPALHEPTINAWLVTRHDDVDTLLRAQGYSRDPRKAAPGTLSSRFATNNPEQLSMLFLDAPDHTRLRGLVNKAFTPRAVAALGPRAQAIADRLLDDVAAQDRFDLIETLAAPFPTIVIAEMLGVDPAEQRQFKQWSDAAVQNLNPFMTPEARAAAEQAGAALAAYFAGVIAERRAAPHDDLISRLIAAQEEGDRLTDMEMVITCALLLAAGNVTTTDLIGNGVLALLEHPAELRKLQDDPELVTRAIEEMLRYDSPVVQTGRTPLSDVEVGGCPIHAGQSIVPALAAANRDPAAYPDPDRFDITRADTHHHSFGGGPHFCLGAPLARLEARVAIGTLVRRFPHIRLAPGATPRRRLLPGFRGLVELHVAVD